MLSVLLSPTFVLADAVQFGWFEHLVETATGWGGLLIVFVYSVLVAVVLPTPSELVLAAPLNLGLSGWATKALIVLVSSAGKAIGSIFAFRVGHGARDSGFVLDFLRRSGVDVVAWSERQVVALAQKWGFAGLAVALSVPGFPDTLSIYAFSVLEDDYVKFAVATFAGSAGRLLLVLFGWKAIAGVF